MDREEAVYLFGTTSMPPLPLFVLSAVGTAVAVIAASVGVAEVMTRNPRTIGPDRLAIDCVDLMEGTPKVTVLLVVDEARRLVGALHLHDLFRARVV